ncbi:hypothetical protein B5807_10917 [Epicoccum nigrum]|uniref:Uncharacterized protein n=1 Tax=Epicoccum nigrum TaxID=105696 RepID=A0A1Y2LKV3_EPING|nr:hypothetical protein B5807_10917 [Epicoccum nigrum]
MEVFGSAMRLVLKKDLKTDATVFLAELLSVSVPSRILDNRVIRPSESLQACVRRSEARPSPSPSHFSLCSALLACIRSAPQRLFPHPSTAQTPWLGAADPPSTHLVSLRDSDSHPPCEARTPAQHARTAWR